MNLICEGCGGKNILPESKMSMYCSFCGNHIEFVVKQPEINGSKKIPGTDKEIVLEYIRGGSVGKLDLIMCDLTGIHIVGANLKGANLRGANLEKAVLNSVDLSGADLSNANLRDCKLHKANLSGANLSGTNLRDADLNEANIINTNLAEAELYFTTKLTGLDLREFDIIRLLKKQSDFQHSNLSGMNLSGYDLKYAHLKYVDLSNSNLSGADLSSADLMGSNLSNANLSNAKLGITKLFNANLHNADLSHSELYHAYLSEADLTNANLTNADLRGAYLSGAIFTGAILKGAKFKDTLGKEKAIGLPSGCYLTTACVEAMHLPDNCHELQTLRNFRDGYVSETEAGRELIQEYYNIAPGIIEAVNATGNGPSIFMNLYSEIREIVSLIDNNKQNEAYQSYCDMTLRLKKKYLS